MPTPPKPSNVIKMEKRSHRTKAELKQRENAEKSLLTGVKLKETAEVKKNPIAHKEFLRLNNLLKKIEKNDDLYGAVINRYCLLLAECAEFEEKRERVFKNIEGLEEAYDAFAEKNDLKAFYSLQKDMQKNMIALDRQVQAKRKMLTDIEKENIMTIASSLRSIPKKVEKKKSPLAEALHG